MVVENIYFSVYHPVGNKTTIKTLIILFQKNVYTLEQKPKEELGDKS